MSITVEVEGFDIDDEVVEVVHGEAGEQCMIMSNWAGRE
jgi:hypothetical protein